MAKTRHNLTKSTKADDVTRRTLYNPINQKKVTASCDQKNNPAIYVFELIRVCGNANRPVKISTVTNCVKIQDNFIPDALETIGTELSELRQAETLILKDKSAREEERRRGEEERRRQQGEVKRLEEEIKREKQWLLVTSFHR